MGTVSGEEGCVLILSMAMAMVVGRGHGGVVQKHEAVYRGAVAELYSSKC